VPWHMTLVATRKDDDDDLRNESSATLKRSGKAIKKREELGSGEGDDMFKLEGWEQSVVSTWKKAS
jgi:hypothetical protein